MFRGGIGVTGVFLPLEDFVLVGVGTLVDDSAAVVD